jgi:Rieske Fe-S protein
MTDEEKLEKAKTSAKAALNAYSTDDYRDAERALLTEYRQKALSAIDAAVTSEEVDAALEDAVTKIAALTTAAEYDAMESGASADTTKVYEGTGKYLSSLGTPGVGSTGGEWLTIGLARAGYPVAGDWSSGYYSNAVKYVQENINKDTGRLHRVKSTDNSRMILALTATGRDVTDVGGYNLLTALADLDYVKKQGNNGPIWALIALDSHNYEIPEVTTGGTQTTRENLIDTILAARNGDGGWSVTTGESSSSDVDMTAMALQALAPYYRDASHPKHAEVKAAVDKALELLSGKQDDNGGFSSWGTSNSESIAQVITALTSLGIDPDKDERFISNGKTAIDALKTYYVEGKGFRHVLTGDSDGMATEQSYYALASYYRLKEKKTALYDMSDVEIMSSGARIAEVEKLIDALPDEIALTDKDTVNAALSAYNGLSGIGKESIDESKVKKLNNAVKKISDLEVKNVENLISGIGRVTLNKEGQIAKANAAYNALSAEQQKQVSNYDVLKEAVDKLASVKSGSSTGTSVKTASGTTKSATKAADVKLTGELTEAAQSGIDMIDAVVKSGLPDDAAEYTDEQKDSILEAYRAYKHLSVEEQLAVEQSDNFDAYSDICRKLGKCWHYDEATGTDLRDNAEKILPWYISLAVKPQTADDRQDDVQEVLGEESELFTLSDISFVNMLDGTEWHPENTLKVKLPMVDIGSYESTVIVHFADDGKVELIEGRISGDEIVFSAADFSLYGIAGSMQSIDDLLAAQETPVIWPWILIGAIALAAVIVLVCIRMRKRRIQ